MGWWELEVEVPTVIGDDVATALIEQGAGGVELINDEHTPPPSTEPLQRAPTSPGHTLLVVSYSGDTRPTDIEPAARRVLAQLEPSLAGQPLRITKRVDESWRERWREFFAPLQIGARLWVIPRWEAERGFVAPNDAIPIIIDPGMAFGTGQHPTTTLCLRFLERYAATLQPGGLLDLGTGSGILSIAAAKLGAPRIVAIDNDAEAIRWAAPSLDLNDVRGQIDLSTTPLAEVDGQFEWVVANILANTLIDLAPMVVARVAPSGHLMLSGILSGQQEEVLAAYDAASESALTLVERAVKDEWVAVLLRRD